MKKIIQKFASLFVAFLMGLGLVAPALTPAPVYAAEGSGAAILTDCWDKGNEEKNGAGIMCVVRLVVNILSVLVGILGVIGIIVVGLQYLTAGGNEEQTRKAKRRLFEIIIGIAAYILLASILNWLLPTFSASDAQDSRLDSSITAMVTPYEV